MTLTLMIMKAMTMMTWKTFSPTFSRTFSSFKGQTQDSAPERGCRRQQEQYMIYNVKAVKIWKIEHNFYLTS